MGQTAKKKIFDGRYEILSIVGRGSASVVYHARSVSDPTSEVALKVLLAPKEGSSNAQLLRREALAMVSSRHRYVIRLDDFHSVGELSYLSMEYAPESDLRRYMGKRGGKLGFAQAELFLLQSAEGLSFVHQAGIVHRDIKPDNVLVISDKEVRLGDFGVAVLPGEPSSIEDLQKGVGTMDYMAPEVLEGKGYDLRSDVYALGVTFYEAITGRHPFEGVSMMKQLEARQDKNLTPLSSLLPGIPYHLSAAIMQAMSYNPDDRFPSAKEFVQSLLVQKSQGAKTPPPAKGEQKIPASAAPLEPTAKATIPPAAPAKQPEPAKAAPQKPAAPAQKPGLNFAKDLAKENVPHAKTKAEETPPQKPQQASKALAAISEATQKQAEPAKPQPKQPSAPPKAAMTPVADKQPAPTAPRPRANVFQMKEVQEVKPTAPQAAPIEAKETSAPAQAITEPIQAPQAEQAKPQIQGPSIAANTALADAAPQPSARLEIKAREPRVAPLSRPAPSSAPEAEEVRDEASEQEPKDQSPMGIIFISLLVLAGILFYRFYSSSVDTQETPTTPAPEVSAPVPQEQAPQRAPEEKRQELDFPLLPGGIYSGVIRGVVANKKIPISFISMPKANAIAVVLGLEGYTPAVLARSDIERRGKDKPIRVRSNGIVLEFTGQKADGELIGSFKNMVTGDEGEWRIRPAE